METITEKALNWIANGRVGLSSRTMWCCFMGAKDFRIDYPHDPDDFSRCYKLLQAVPEWKNELHKLKTLSPQWSALIDNWDELTRMYELNDAEGWRNADQIGMFDFMQKLLNKQ